jgi:hypothetical protein
VTIRVVDDLTEALDRAAWIQKAEPFLKRLVFVDCEAVGPCPSKGRLTEFGAVHYTTKATFHGEVCKAEVAGERVQVAYSPEREKEVFQHFQDWLFHHVPWKAIQNAQDPRREQIINHPVFVSDNPAWDFQWIQDGFWRTLGHNPFGHSARRIGDFYAGLVGDFGASAQWKRLRITKHDHHPVHDALGNVEAFERMLKGERA